ncbi:MAG: complement resistance protein TraT [Desulfuromonadaceae bacterium]|nr:complement resistance protein TraT [Desulfuromonadaceae bacterium]
MRRILTICSVAIGLFFLSGCATTTPEIQSKMTRTISLSPNLLQNKVLFLRVTGTEASVLNLEEPLKEALRQKGVKLVENPDEAKISLHINTLFANNLKEAANYKASLIGGGVAGGMAKGYGHNSGDSILIGVGVALAMGIAEHALADETYRAIVDVSLRTKTNETSWSDEEKTRILVEAVQMGLKVEEAKPTMETHVIQKISDILK